MGKSTINGPFSIAMLNYQRVYLANFCVRVFLFLGGMTEHGVYTTLQQLWKMMINHQVLKYCFDPQTLWDIKYINRPRFWGFHTRYVLHFFWVHCMTAFKGVGTNGTPNLMTHEMPGISGRWMVVAQAALIFIHFWLKNFRFLVALVAPQHPAASVF
jgi:hypothetical protein